MIRPTSLILMVLAATAGGGLFQVAFEVSELDEKLAQLNRDIRADRDEIHVLRAEWSFLNQPERLEELTRRHLDLMPVSGAQIAGTGAIPVMPEDKILETGSIFAANVMSASTPTAIIAAPKNKPAAPASSTAAPQMTAKPANRADVGRSLDDVLHEVLTTPVSSSRSIAR